MSIQQPTNINAYHTEALAALARANQAQQEAESAVAAYVAQGGKESDVRPDAVKANRSAKSGKFVDEGEAKANPDTTVKEKVKPGKPVEVVLPDEFKVGKVAYKAEHAANGKVYKYTKDGATIKKAEYSAAYEASVKDADNV